MSTSSILLQATAASRLLEYELKLQKGQGQLCGAQGFQKTLQAQCPLWVISGNSHHEHMLSALPPKADIRARSGQVRLVPKGDIAALSIGPPQRVGQDTPGLTGESLSGV
jgi:hypothetical protein